MTAPNLCSPGIYRTIWGTRESSLLHKPGSESIQAFLAVPLLIPGHISSHALPMIRACSLERSFLQHELTLPRNSLFFQLCEWAVGVGEAIGDCRGDRFEPLWHRHSLV
jgi:hypothetical protein